MEVEVIVEIPAPRYGRVPSKLRTEKNLEAQPRLGRILRRHDDLDSIAGRDQNGFGDFRMSDKLTKRFLEGIALRRKMFADLHRGTPMAHPQKKNLHRRTSTPITAKSRNAKPPTAAAAAWRAPWWPAKRAKLMAA